MEERRPVSTHSVLRFSEALFELGFNEDDDDASLDDETTQLFSPGASPTSCPETFARQGKQIGRYVLKSELGEGGFGTVWLADQLEPIRREVAIKLIKPGMSSKRLISRFESERQALAIMNHPNIAAVLDAGTTDQDLPYFVMELVRGAPITQYCDRQKMALRDRLRLFLPVCQAVHHAHQKAILHRDLKPSNILVGEVDERIEPKIIDFGIAKALGTSIQDQIHFSSMFTAQGFVVGTPQYMSPEQAGGSQDADTRSDIYALGAILYELVTGQPPLVDKIPPSSPFDQMLHAIREVTPTRPSALIHQHESEAPFQRAATIRQSTPRRLSQQLLGEIDWIILKALEKEPARRYDSAAAMAADIEKHLDNQPISARPPSRTYTLRKFIKRNRTAVAYSMVALACLLFGISAAVWSYIGQREALRHALVSELLAKDEAEKNVRASLFLGGIFKDISLRNRHSLTPHALRELLDAANERRASELHQQPEIDALVSLILANAFREINQLISAVELYSNALKRMRSSDKSSSIESAQCHYWLAWIQRHQNDNSGLATGVSQALKQIDDCLSVIESTQPRPTELTLLARIQRAALLRQSGQFDEAALLLDQISKGPDRTTLRESSASGWLYREQALLKMRTGAYDEAEGLLIQATNLLTSSATSESMRLQARADILGLRATLHARADRHEEALQTLEDELDVRHIWLLQSDAALMVRMADSLMALNRDWEAGAKLQQAMQIASDNKDTTAMENALRKLLQIQRKRGDPNPPYTLMLSIQLADVLATQLDSLEANQEAWQGKQQQLNELFAVLSPTPTTPDLAPLLVIRASVRARRNELDKAIDDLTTAQRILTSDHSLSFRIATMCAASQRDEEITPMLTQLLAQADRPEAQEDQMIIYWACRIMLLCPSARTNHTLLQPYFERAVNGPTFANLPDWTKLFLGVMEYSNAAYSGAHDWFDSVTQSEDSTVAAYALLFSSMNYGKLGNATLAQSRLAEAKAFYEQKFEPYLSHDSNPPLHDTLSIRRLLSEAQQSVRALGTAP